MGSVYRKSFTKPLPPTAETFVRTGQRFVRWKDAKGKLRTAALTTGKDGAERIIVEARRFTAKYRDGSGVVLEVATGCRDETAARKVLAELERRAELVKAGVLTSAEDARAGHQPKPLATHFDAYLTSMEAKGTSAEHRYNVRNTLDRIAADCGFSKLPDLNRHPFEKWLVARSAEGMGARTRNYYRAALVAFCNWCVVTDRLTINSFAKIAKADEDADRRRQRRALTEAELVALLDAARRRPLLDASTVRRGKRKGQAVAKLTPEVTTELDRLGRERALIYKTLVLTGLRKGELASLTVGQLHLDVEPPYLELAAADEKNRQGSSIPLRSDLANDLRAWLDEKQQAWKAVSEAPTIRFDATNARKAKRVKIEAEASSGQSCQPLAKLPLLPHDAPLFNVPAGLIRILDRDLVLAGIARRVKVGRNWVVEKTDERGRTIDVHALRHTYGTMLSRAGVAPRTAQAAMRHSSIDLTMNVYTDPKLLDVAGAVESLPSLPIGPKDGQSHESRIAARPSGTEDLRSSPLAPGLAPTSDVSCASRSTSDKTAGGEGIQIRAVRNVVSGDAVKRNKPLTTGVNGLHQERATGLEPATSSLGS